MKKHMIMVAMASVALMVAGCNKDEVAEAPKPLALDTLDKKVSYIFGYDIATKTKNINFPLDADAISQAVADVNNGAEQRLNEEEMRATMMAFQAEQQAKQQEKASALSDANVKKAQDFLDANRVKEGVVETASGLQYKILTQGSGASPSLEQSVVAHYRGTTLDGKEFDSSYAGEPREFPVNALIPAWIEALQLMKVGGKWELYAPAKLAYGVGGKRNYQTGEFDIEPNSLLKFEMELIAIKDAPKAEPTAELNDK